MSNQSAPQPGPGPEDARPSKDWNPAPLASGGDASYANRGTQAPTPPPRSGAGRLPKVDVEQFAPTRSPWPILALVAVALVAALIIYTTSWRPAPKPSATASAQPSASQTSQPGASSTPDPQQPFVAPGGDPAGCWEVVEHHWDASGLEALLRIKVSKGTLDYTLNVIDSGGLVRISAQVSSLTPALDFQPIEEGQEVLGWVRFDAGRGDTTLALVTGLQEQLSALPVSG